MWKLPKTPRSVNAIVIGALSWRPWIAVCEGGAKILASGCW
ncbi:hypothetical protein HMPREF9344_01816 [Cutibacterium acnes HL097PA1]|nr:hypothetical protein HMPREF9344_01816 [Cutibacterium acnes HL097PA1]